MKSKSLDSRSDRNNTETKKPDHRAYGQRDRDRIMYSSFFRRLAGVTQVISPNEGQVCHNRLTHTLEAAQIARRLVEELLREKQNRTLAKKLGGIDPDVVEAACLAHDLGHPPFGHIGEMELDKLAIAEGELDGFEGNAQSFRILTKLTNHRKAYPGLNLSRATLNAVLKYPWFKFRERHGQSSLKCRKYGAYRSEEDDFKFARKEWGENEQVSVEAAIMDYADSVAYSTHDLDDFYRAGLIPVGRLKHDYNEFRGFLRQWAASDESLRDNIKSHEEHLYNLFDNIFPEVRYCGSYKQRTLLKTINSNLIKDFVYGAVELHTPDENGKVLTIEPNKKIELEFLQRLVRDFVHGDPQLAIQQYSQRKIVQTLFEIYLDAAKKEDKDLIPQRFHDDLKEPQTSKVRLVVDIIASFTDTQAIELYKRFKSISLGPVTDSLML